MVVNNIDLLPHLEFDLDKLLYNIGVVNAGATAIVTSARTGEGIGELRGWLAELTNRRVGAVA